jgi:hypothetical protein
MLPSGEHSKLHGPWNPGWRVLIMSFVDWNALEKSGGRVLRFREPFHRDASGNLESISREKLATMVLSLGATQQLWLMAMAGGMPALIDYGKYDKEIYEKRPLTRLAMGMTPTMANKLGLLGPRLVNGVLEP